MELCMESGLKAFLLDIKYLQSCASMLQKKRISQLTYKRIQELESAGSQLQRSVESYLEDLTDVLEDRDKRQAATLFWEQKSNNQRVKPVKRRLSVPMFAEVPTGLSPVDVQRLFEDDLGGLLETSIDVLHQ
eukprot:Filipodium_phascolosomae@DN7184_c0_g1_i1.p1